MSTLKVNTLTDTAATKSVPIEDVVNGTARAWVNFNGTGTVAIRAQYNVDGITDNAAGDYTINFTTALADTNYAVSLSNLAASATNVTVNIAIAGVYTSSATTKTTTQLRIASGSSAAAGLLDNADLSVTIFR